MGSTSGWPVASAVARRPTRARVMNSLTSEVSAVMPA